MKCSSAMLQNLRYFKYVYENQHTFCLFIFHCVQLYFLLMNTIHKGKSKAEAKNYRPVALTSLLIKIFEKVIRKQLVSFMDEHQLFNKSQHGFRSGRSCLSQLLYHFDLITRSLEEGHSVDIIYLDFSKAFDKVDIGLILRKLQFIGIGGL